jgi:starch phosphorylase
MVMQYTDEYYLAARRRRQNLQADYAAKAKGLAAWRNKVERAWPRICVKSIQHGVSEIDMGQEVQVSARVFLDTLNPEDVAVQVLSGRVDASGEIKNPSVISMESFEQEGAGNFVFRTMLRSDGRSGLHGYAIRVLPRHCDSSTMFLPGLITWASEVGAAVRELALQS